MISPNPLDFKEILVCIVTPDPGSVEMPGTTHHERKTTVQLEAENNNISHNETLIERDYFQDLSFAYVSTSYPVTKYYQTGVLDMHIMPMGDTSHHFTHGIAGPSVKDFVDSLFIDTGFVSVSGFSLEQLAFYFNDEFETVNEWMQEYDRTDSRITSTGRELNFGLPSMQELASYLDAGISPTDLSALYIPDTTNFPDSGKLLVGKEIISYTSKLPDRFLNLTRQVDGSPSQAHAAGQILRTIGNATTS
jgi:hypothetical protein